MENFLVKYRPTVWEDVVGQESVVRTLKNMIITGSFLAGLLLSGVYGIGKTTLAKLVARSLLCGRRRPGTFNPCNDCGSCNSKSHGGNFIERNCAKLTTEQIESDLVSYMIFQITYYDEFQRVKIPVQEMLLKALEGDPYPLNKLFVFSTVEAEKVDEGLLQRVTHLKLVPPTVEQLTPWLEKICDRASILIEDRSALGLIAEDCKCIPRTCLKFLFEHCIPSEEPISRHLVQKAVRIDALGKEKITAHTKF